MVSLLDIAWLIPVMPFAGALLIGTLLVSFDRTMNRLTKPVSFLMISCVVISTIISLIFYLKHLSGQVFLGKYNLVGKDILIDLHIGDITSIILTALGFLIASLMIYSYYFTQRERGYVRYFVCLGLVCGSVSSVILSLNFPL